MIKYKRLRMSKIEWLIRELNEIDGRIITVWKTVNQSTSGFFVSSSIDYEIIYEVREDE